MADISKIVLPDNSTKNIKDSTARSTINILEVMNGAKNLLSFNAVDEIAGESITWTLNSNNTISASGTTSSTDMIILQTDETAVDIIDYCDGNHYLLGCPTDGSSTTYQLIASSSNTSTAGTYELCDTGSGVLLTTPNAGIEHIYVKVGVYSSYSGTGLSFAPMIITKDAYDAGFINYQQYAKTNVELTNEVDSMMKLYVDGSGYISVQYGGVL